MDAMTAPASADKPRRSHNLANSCAASITSVPSSKFPQHDIPGGHSTGSPNVKNCELTSQRLDAISQNGADVPHVLRAAPRGRIFEPHTRILMLEEPQQTLPAPRARTTPEKSLAGGGYSFSLCGLPAPGSQIRVDRARGDTWDS
jgi:hypothetical protein